MAEKQKNVFEKFDEGLRIIADELNGANNALYVVATSVLDLDDKLDALTAKIDSLIDIVTKLLAKEAETPVTKVPETSPLTYPEGKKRAK